MSEHPYFYLDALCKIAKGVDDPKAYADSIVRSAPAAGSHTEVRAGGAQDGGGFDVTLHKHFVATFADREWAHAFAAFVESMLETQPLQGWAHRDQERRLQRLLMNLPALRWLVADTFRRGAELYRAQALQSDAGTEADTLRRLARELEDEAERLGGTRAG